MMTTQKLRCAVNHQMCAMSQWLREHRCCKGVIYAQMHYRVDRQSRQGDRDQGPKHQWTPEIALINKRVLSVIDHFMYVGVCGIDEVNIDAKFPKNPIGKSPCRYQGPLRA